MYNKSDQNERLQPPDRIGVTDQHTQTVPGLAPQPQFTVKAGGPEAKVANGEALHAHVRGRDEAVRLAKGAIDAHGR